MNGLTEADAEYSRYECVLISRITWMEVFVRANGDEIELCDFFKHHF
ncbi:MAG: hypothetical protein HYV26_01370 [Candidatus Hydrogenedentes bacterium]|nr:hypothetical protein [Candidatus Hydrogenedentota bacterium]